jgi:hypothetical protein
MKKLICSWCGRLTDSIEGEVIYCPGCRHRADAIGMDCDCPACAAADPGFVVRDKGRGKYLGVFDPETGVKTYTADPVKARVFRGATWRRVWSGSGASMVEVAPAVADQAA